MLVLFAILRVAMIQCTLPSFIMTDNENDESFFPLLTSDSETTFMNLIDLGESTLENIFADLDEEEGNMNDIPSYAAMPTDNKGKEESSSDEEPAPKKSKGLEKEESSGDRNGESSSEEELAPKKSKKEDDASYEDDSNSSDEEADDEDADDEDELDMNKNTSDEDMSEKELDLPANRNRKEKGKAVEPNHHRRKIQRNMAAQGLYENRDVTQLTSIVATSPRLKAILDENLPKWQPSLPLLVRSTRFPHRLGPCRLLS